LEPPRHLVIFTQNSLAQALRKAGFADLPQDMPWRPLCRRIWGISESLAGDLGQDLERYVAEAEQRARIDPKIREFISWRMHKSG